MVSMTLAIYYIFARTFEHMLLSLGLRKVILYASGDLESGMYSSKITLLGKQQGYFTMNLVFSL